MAAMAEVFKWHGASILRSAPNDIEKHKTELRLSKGLQGPPVPRVCSLPDKLNEQGVNIVRISKKLSAALAGALILGTSTFANAVDTTFSFVSADPPFNGRVDCSAVFASYGISLKNPGQVLTLIKAFTDAGNNMHRQAEFVGLDNSGDMFKSKIFEDCNIGPK